MKKLSKIVRLLGVVFFCGMVTTFFSCSDDGSSSDSASAILEELGYTEPTLPTFSGTNALAGLTISSVDGIFVFSDSSALYTYDGYTNTLSYTYDDDNGIVYLKYVKMNGYAIKEVVSILSSEYSGDELAYQLSYWISTFFYRIYAYKVEKDEKEVKFSSYFSGDISTSELEFEASSSNILTECIGYWFPTMNSDYYSNDSLRLNFVLKWNTTNKTFTATIYETYNYDKNPKQITNAVKGNYTCSDAEIPTTSTNVALTFTNVPDITNSVSGTYSKYSSLLNSTQTFNYEMEDANGFAGEYVIQY